MCLARDQPFLPGALFPVISADSSRNQDLGAKCAQADNILSLPYREGHCSLKRLGNLSEVTWLFYFSLCAHFIRKPRLSASLHLIMNLTLSTVCPGCRKRWETVPTAPLLLAEWQAQHPCECGYCWHRFMFSRRRRCAHVCLQGVPRRVPRAGSSGLQWAFSQPPCVPPRPGPWHTQALTQEVRRESLPGPQQPWSKRGSALPPATCPPSSTWAAISNHLLSVEGGADIWKLPEF